MADSIRDMRRSIYERGLLQIFRWAIERGQKVDNPAELLRPADIARLEPRERALTPDEIGLMYQYIERIGTTASIRAAANFCS